MNWPHCVTLLLKSAQKVNNPDNLDMIAWKWGILPELGLQPEDKRVDLSMQKPKATFGDLLQQTTQTSLKC